MSALREVFARFVVQFDKRELDEGTKGVSALEAALAGIAGALSAGVVLLAVQKFSEEMKLLAGEIREVMDLTGLSVKEAQRWRLAAELSGVGTAKFTEGVANLQRQMSKASEGMGSAGDRFRSLGVSIRDSEGALRPVEDVMQDLADPINALGGSAEKTAVLMDLFGESGEHLAPLFEDGAAGLAEMREELDRLGGVSAEAFEDAETLEEEQLRLTTAVQGLKSILAEFLLPALTSMVRLLTSVSVAVRRFIRDEEKMLAVTTLLSAALLVLTARRLPLLISVLWSSAKAAAGAVIAYAPLVATWVLAAAAVFALFLILEDLFTAMNGGKSALGDFANEFQDLLEMHEDNPIVAFWQEVIDTVERAIAATTGFFGGDLDVATNVRGIGATAENNELRTGREGFNSGLRAFVPDRERTASERRAELNNREVATSRGVTQPTVVNQVNVTATGSDPREMARETERVVTRVLDRQASESIDSLTQGAG